ncbi:uncharacterized protein VTP21DRAFT_8768 [Calcarisporiella thermophila]|uniref:uncharacterized protein n=1 Tax=Calcarisporiella thermophila TaxID=911321 RepID=UPI003742A2F1
MHDSDNDLPLPDHPKTPPPAKSIMMAAHGTTTPNPFTDDISPPNSADSSPTRISPSQIHPLAQQEHASHPMKEDRILELSPPRTPTPTACGFTTTYNLEKGEILLQGHTGRPDKRVIVDGRNWVYTSDGGKWVAMQLAEGNQWCLKPQDSDAPQAFLHRSEDIYQFEWGGQSYRWETLYAQPVAVVDRMSYPNNAKRKWRTDVREWVCLSEQNTKVAEWERRFLITVDEPDLEAVLILSGLIASHFLLFFTAECTRRRSCRQLGGGIFTEDEEEGSLGSEEEGEGIHPFQINGLEGNTRHPDPDYRTETVTPGSKAGLESDARSSRPSLSSYAETTATSERRLSFSTMGSLELVRHRRVCGCDIPTVSCFDDDTWIGACIYRIRRKLCILS